MAYVENTGVENDLEEQRFCARGPPNESCSRGFGRAPAAFTVHGTEPPSFLHAALLKMSVFGCFSTVRQRISPNQHVFDCTAPALMSIMSGAPIGHPTEASGFSILAFAQRHD